LCSFLSRPGAKQFVPGVGRAEFQAHPFSPNLAPDLTSPQRGRFPGQLCQSSRISVQIIYGFGIRTGVLDKTPFIPRDNISDGSKQIKLTCPWGGIGGHSQYPPPAIEPVLALLDISGTTVTPITEICQGVLFAGDGRYNFTNFDCNNTELGRRMKIVCRMCRHTGLQGGVVYDYHNWQVSWDNWTAGLKSKIRLSFAKGKFNSVDRMELHRTIYIYAQNKTLFLEICTYVHNLQNNDE
jgi:hypothetical protein